MNRKKKPIRVAVVMGKYVTGGIKSVILNYYKAIDKDIIQFDLIVDKNSPDRDYNEFSSLGANIYEVTSIGENPFKNVNEIRKILKENNYKIVHGYLNTLNVFSMCAGFIAGTKIRIAENLSTAHPKEPKTFIKNMLKPFGKLFATNLAANSKYAAEWLYGKSEINKIEILRNGLDLEYFQHKPGIREIRRKELVLDSDVFLIGHIGRYQFQKNHHLLIDIFKRINEIDSRTRLLLIGYGELKEEIWEKIEKLELGEFVIDGGASTDNIANYNAMDCFVMPSYYEGLPVVGIEAQATGLPCVFSSEITKETAVIKQVSFLTLEEDIDSWAKEILSFKGYSRTDTKKELTNRGYNIEVESKRICSYYCSLLN